jgi:hypothetical protein
MSHPATGPITPEEMARIAALPYGKAHEELRKHDPAWGLATADNPILKWEITLSGSAPVYALVEVEAADEETARKLALRERVPSSDWDLDTLDYVDDIEVFEVRALKP